jgi:ABC-type transporter Mla subunit MlaD
MPRRLHWSELTGGVIAAVVIAGLVVITLLFARVGALHGRKITLYVVTDDATGVLPGTEVWLGGKKEGVVKNVAFRPPSTDTLERVILTTDFLREALSNLRRDSYAQIKPGGSLIGAPIVYISLGTSDSRQLRDGDTIRTRPSGAIANLAQDIGTIQPEVAALASEVKKLNAKAASPSGSVGSFRAHGIQAMPELNARMSQLSAKAMNANGTIALASRGNLMERASRAMSGADSIHTLMSSSRSSLGRFRRDSTLMTKASGVMAELDSLSMLLSDPMGSIGGSHSDSALTRGLARSRSLLDSLMKDAKKHPLRYISL